MPRFGTAERGIGLCCGNQGAQRTPNIAVYVTSSPVPRKGYIGGIQITDSRIDMTSTIKLAAIGLVLLGSVGCKITPGFFKPLPGRCGTFHLDAQAHQPGGFPRPKMFFTQTFNFKPEMCAVQSCSCSRITFVQLIRFVELSDSGTFDVFQVHDEQEERMLRDPTNIAAHGWSLDREEGRQSPFYGWNDDGSWDAYQYSPTLDITFNQGRIHPGTNGDATKMWDAIGHDHTGPFRVDVVQAPMCIEPQSSCSGRVLGYYGFTFGVYPDPIHTQTIGNLIKDVTFSDLPGVLTYAVRNWNEQDDKQQLTIVDPHP
jgi:hypothetical protein